MEIFKRVAVQSESLLEKAAGYLRLFGSVILFMAVFVVTADVFGRYVFNQPMRGSMEIYELILAVVIFSALADSIRKREHVAVDLLFVRLSTRQQAIIITIGDFLVLGVLVLLAWQGFSAILSSISLHETTDYWRFPLVSIKMFLFVTYVLAALMVMMQIWSSICKKMKPA